MENILVDMDWCGRTRKLLLHPGRTGFMFVLDRETGELLSAEKFMPSANWASGFDLKAGLPKINELKRTHQGKVTQDICPSSTAGEGVCPLLFFPRTRLLCIPAHNTCMDYEGLGQSGNPGCECVPILITCRIRNVRGQGYENQLAQLVARDLGRTVQFVWTPELGDFCARRTARVPGLKDALEVNEQYGLGNS